MSRNKWVTRTVSVCAAPIVVTSGLATVAQAEDTGAAETAESSECKALHLVLVNGTADSSSDVDPDQDSGYFTQVAVPAILASPDIGRSYVPYPASFGGKIGDREKDTYADSMLKGIDNANAIITEVAAECPDTQFFVAGYSQGAQVASAISREVGAGTGPVPASRFAGAALLSDPTRAPGSDVFPGKPGTTSPAPAPGTSGSAVADIVVAKADGPEGGGIAPNSSAPTFGAVGDRVASFCAAGDLACDTLTDAPLARLVANVAGQSSMDTDDPVKIISDVALALGTSGIMAGAEHLTETVSFNGDRFEMKSTGKTMVGRMAHYSNPINQEAGVESAIGALVKIGGMGIGAGITVLKDVLAPDALASYAAVGLANPAAAAALVVGRLGTSVLKLFPPATVNEGVQVIYDEVANTVDDNAGLAEMALDTKYWSTISQHGSYASTPEGTNGQTAVELVTDWVVAVAEDLGAQVTPGYDTSRTTGSSTEILASTTAVSAAEILSR